MRGSRGRPPLAIEDQKKKAEEGLKHKQNVQTTKKSDGKRKFNRAEIKKAANLAAARMDRSKKKEDKDNLVRIISEIRRICLQKDIVLTRTARSILSLFNEEVNERNQETRSESQTTPQEDLSAKKRQKNA